MIPTWHTQSKQHKIKQILLIKTGCIYLHNNGLAFIFTLLAFSYGSAQETPFPIAYAAEGIHTVLLHPVGIPTAPAFIPLDNGQLELHFDDLGTEYRNFEVRWTHCTFDWYPSPDMAVSDWTVGFAPLSFRDIQGSFNTRVDYTHYQMRFPNELMQFSKSGNYLLEVYDSAEPKIPVIQRRMVVYESLVDIEIHVREGTNIGEKRTHQEVDYAVTHSSDRFSLIDAYDALQTIVLQNGRWDNALVGLEPRFVRGEEVTFNQQGVDAFEGLNSWRFADLKSLRFNSQGIDRIEEGRAFWNIHLTPDKPRTFSFHQARPDLDGAYVVANERQDDYTGSDYVQTHFRLECDDPMHEQEVYVFGQCSDWMYTASNQMNWNAQLGQYELTLFLKQGYYNYLYGSRAASIGFDHRSEALKRDPGRFQLLEGAHAVADNHYHVIAYYWDLSGYDRVIGFESAKYSGME